MPEPEVFARRLSPEEQTVWEEEFYKRGYLEGVNPVISDKLTPSKMLSLDNPVRYFACPSCGAHVDYKKDANRYFRGDITGWSCPECTYIIEEKELKRNLSPPGTPVTADNARCNICNIELKYTSLKNHLGTHSKEALRAAGYDTTYSYISDLYLVAPNNAVPYARGVIPRTTEKSPKFRKMFRSMVKQYGPEKGRQVFYATLRGVQMPAGARYPHAERNFVMPPGTPMTAGTENPPKGAKFVGKGKTKDGRRGNLYKLGKKTYFIANPPRNPWMHPMYVKDGEVYAGQKEFIAGSESYHLGPYKENFVMPPGTPVTADANGPPRYFRPKRSGRKGVRRLGERTGDYHWVEGHQRRYPREEDNFVVPPGTPMIADSNPLYQRGDGVLAQVRPGYWVPGAYIEQRGELMKVITGHGDVWVHRASVQPRQNNNPIDGVRIKSNASGVVKFLPSQEEAKKFEASMRKAGVPVQIRPRAELDGTWGVEFFEPGRRRR